MRGDCFEFGVDDGALGVSAETDVGVAVASGVDVVSAEAWDADFRGVVSTFSTAFSAVCSAGFDCDASCEAVADM